VTAPEPIDLEVADLIEWWDWEQQRSSNKIPIDWIAQLPPDQQQERRKQAYAIVERLGPDKARELRDRVYARLGV
jgi:hypothetical protein